MSDGEEDGDPQQSSPQRIRELIRVLEAFPKKRDVLVAFGHLKSISKGDNVNKERIGTSGGSIALLKLLEHPDIEIQREAVRLLRSISVNEAAQERISVDGGIPILLELLASTDDFSLNLGATAVLWNLSVNDENKTKIVEGGGILLLLNLIKTGDVKLQNEAVGCFRNLSMDNLDDNKRIMGRDGVIPPLVSLLRCRDEKIQRNAALTLRNLSHGNEKNLKRIERERGSELLMKVLSDHNLESSQALVGSRAPEKKWTFESTISWDELSQNITKKIGEGKYGDVYKAKYQGYTVAAKIIKKELNDKSPDSESTLEELRIMQLLKHQNIVLQMGVCLNPLNQVVIVTEFLEKGSLKDVLPEVKSLQIRLKMGEDLAKGLSWLHAHRIIHRDLKLANLLVAADYTVKIGDFGLSLQYREGVVCRGFKGNVKYSPPEILRARYDKNITIYPYSEKTDVYGYGLMMWEIVTMEALFPHIKGKEELTKHVLAGQRPSLKKHWPASLKELLSLSWHEDPKKRPYFPTITKRYDQIVSDVMCPDMSGRKIVKQLWKGKAKANKIPFHDFQKTFTDLLKPDFTRVKKIHIKCFQAVLSLGDPFDDTVSFGRFCNVVAWFGPIQPVDSFLARIKELLSQSYFHGFLSLAKGTSLAKSFFESPKGDGVVYLYRFSNTDMGGFVLTYVDKEGDVHHKKIQRTPDGGFHCDDPKLDFPTIKHLHKAFKQIYKLSKPVPGSPYSTLFK